jgi:hypothetical protein
MTSLFDQALDACIKQATADENEDLAKRQYRKGDIAHLKRWRHDGRAAAIWEALRPGKSSDRAGMLRLVLKVLEIRAIAEDAAGLNNKFKQERQYWRLLKPSLLPQEFEHITNALKECERQFVRLYMTLLGAKFAVRSDKGGTRRRTIFCRIASDKLRQAGRWHDKEVAALCEIALDCEVDVTTDMVRSAREAGRREATREKY